MWKSFNYTYYYLFIQIIFIIQIKIENYRYYYFFIQIIFIIQIKSKIIGKVCASKSVYLYKSLYSLKVYKFACAHFSSFCSNIQHSPSTEHIPLFWSWDDDVSLGQQFQICSGFSCQNHHLQSQASKPKTKSIVKFRQSITKLKNGK